MPGARPKGFRNGDDSEKFAENIIRKLAFTTPVPRTEDVGIDFYCSLMKKEGRLLKAGPFFTVQVKSGRSEIVYEKEYEIEWIMNQDNPFFVCIAEPKNLSIKLYSTWNMLNGFLYRKPSMVVLAPGGLDDGFKEFQWFDDNSKLIVSLGKPIVHILMEEINDDPKLQKYREALEEWVLLDRINIVNAGADMHWVVGPTEYETNKTLTQTSKLGIWFYWNPRNEEKCMRNFCRAATALRLTLRSALGPERENLPKFKDMILNLEQVLKSYSSYLEPLAKEVLIDQVKMEL
jgi:hypothetical protein